MSHFPPHYSLLHIAFRIIDLPLKFDDGQLSLPLEIIFYATFTLIVIKIETCFVMECSISIRAPQHFDVVGMLNDQYWAMNLKMMNLVQLTSPLLRPTNYYKVKEFSWNYSRPHRTLVPRLAIEQYLGLALELKKEERIVIFV